MSARTPCSRSVPQRPLLGSHKRSQICWSGPKSKTCSTQTPHSPCRSILLCVGVSVLLAASQAHPMPCAQTHAAPSKERLRTHHSYCERHPSRMPTTQSSIKPMYPKHFIPEQPHGTARCMHAHIRTRSMQQRPGQPPTKWPAAIPLQKIATCRRLADG